MRFRQQCLNKQGTFILHVSNTFTLCLAMRDFSTFTHLTPRFRSSKFRTLQFFLKSSLHRLAVYQSNSDISQRIAAKMCQLCILITISQNSRWPKPLEPLVSDLHLLVTTAHSEFAFSKPSTTPDTKANSYSNPPTTSTSTTITITSTPAQNTKSSLLTTLREIKTLLEVLEEERTTWWDNKAKERKFWRETYQEDKITKINVVNNKTVDMIEGLKARLGTFCRWSLGLEDGVEGSDGVEKEGGGVKMEGEDVKMEG